MLLIRRSLLLGVLLVVATVAAADDCRYAFTTGDKFGYGLMPSAVFADFNEDGLVDFVANDGVFNYLYLNRGFGQYDKKRLALEGDVLAATDVDGDGHVDVVLEPFVRVALGDGKGNFSAEISSGTDPVIGERLVDLNGDGLKDVIYTTDTFPAALMVQFGVGGGHFGPPTEVLPQERSAYDLTYRVGDFDGDGAPDLFWVHHIWWNDGKGHFTPTPDNVGDPTDASILDPFDVDHDGADDLLFATTTGALILVRMRGRNATITPVTSDDPSPSGGNLNALVDLDGDGYLDAVFSDEMVVWGSPDPTHLETTHFDLKTTPSGVIGKGPAVLDFDGDGRLDLVGMGGVDGLAILHTKPGSRQLFAGDVMWMPLLDYSSPFSAIGDINGDGLPDRVVMDVPSGVGSVYLNDGKGHFTFHNSFGGGAVGTDGGIAIADFDGDSNADLLVVSKQLQILFGDGHGSFVSSPVIAKWGTNPNFSVIRARRGGRSIALMTENETSKDVLTLSVAPDRTATVTPVAGITSDQLHDYTSIDGVPAMFVQVDFAHWELREFIGDGWSTIGTLETGYAPTVLDLDGDGKSEIVYWGLQGGAFMTRVTPSGLSTPQKTVNLPALAGIRYVADVDGDGKSDLVFVQQTYEYSWQVQVAHNTGAGFELAPATTITSGSIMTADVNGDGRDDLVFFDTARVEVLTSTCVPVPPVVSHVIPAIPLAGDDVKVTIEDGYSYATLIDGSGKTSNGIGQQDGSVSYDLGRLPVGTHIFTYDEATPRFGTRHATITVTVFDSVPRRHLIRH